MTEDSNLQGVIAIPGIYEPNNTVSNSVRQIPIELKTKTKTPPP